LGPRGAAAQGACDRWVVTAGANSSDCSNEAQPCKTVQYAIDQSVDGDVICVASLSAVLDPTVYHEHLFIDHTLTLDGKWAATCSPFGFACDFSPVTCTPERVVLDGFRQGRVITINGTIKPTIDCFTITGGDANGLGGDPGGKLAGTGGELVENHAGGGIFSRDASADHRQQHHHRQLWLRLVHWRLWSWGRRLSPQGACHSQNQRQRNRRECGDDSTWGIGGGIMLRDSDASELQHRCGQPGRFFGRLRRRDRGEERMPTIAYNEVAGNVAGQAVQGLAAASLCGRPQRRSLSTNGS